MGTYTAQILVGYEDPFHSGLQYPTHQIFLKENSEAKLELREFNKENPIAIWLPTIENILEDVLLMIGIHISKDNNLINTARKFCGKSNLNNISMIDDFKNSERQTLYNMCKNIKNFPEKLIFSVFKGSSLKPYKRILKNYPLKFYEVLKA